MTQPEQPRIYLDTRYSAPTGNKLRPQNAAELQAALNSVQPNGEILLPAGAVFVGNFQLPKKADGGLIHIRTDAQLPAEGQRVKPTDAAGFAKILTANNDGALITQAG